MKKLLLATTLAAAFASPAFAQYVDPTTGDTYYDPPNFHIQPTGTGTAPTQDPVQITSTNQFFVQDTSKAISEPLTLYFAVPNGEAAPIVTKLLYESLPPDVAPTAILSLGTYMGATDLYSAVNHDCATIPKACDNSVNWSNITKAEAPLFGGTAPTSFNLYSTTADVSFSGGDFVEVDGAFQLGTIVIPFAENVVPTISCKRGKCTTTFNYTYFDTTWTNTGLFTSDGGGSGGVPGTVPELSTWAMMGFGFAGLGFGGYRRARKSVAFAA
jgi:hypothetical protein